jgi:hypothetical protein
MFTRARYWSLSWAKSNQSIPPQSIFLRSILILSSHLTFKSSLWFSSLYLTYQYSMYIPLRPMRATFPAHFTLLDLIILISISGEDYTLLYSSLSNFLQSPIISFPFGSNILLSTLSSNTLNLCSLNVRDQVSPI